MKITEITVRKAKRETTKSLGGDYHMSEADITLVVEADETFDEHQVIDKVKALVVETMDDDPYALIHKSPNETKGGE